MRVNPFDDAFKFLFHSGWPTLVFWLLMVASIALAILNFRRDPKQRSGRKCLELACPFFYWCHVVATVIVDMLLTYTDQPDGSGGLRYWMGEMVSYAGFPIHYGDLCEKR